MNADRPLALRLPLHGRQLIEASAGTGKTFTLTALYLRLVLGQDTPGAPIGIPRMPPQILVMTFTEAATQELRARIRQRLVEAAAAFRADPDTLSDPLLRQLRADLSADDLPACISRLDQAAQWMDEAAIHTIHGWCQRMLREHAFARGQLFEQRLERDSAPRLEEAVNDYWRACCYPLTGAALDWVYQHWNNPRELTKKIRPLWHEFAAVPDDSLAARYAAAASKRQDKLAELKRPWRQWTGQLREFCEQSERDSLLDKKKLRAQYYLPWFKQLDGWANDEIQDSLELGKGFQRLTPAGLAEAWRGETPPEHPALTAMAELPAQLDQLPSIAPALLAHAAAWVRARFEQMARQRAEISFDDLLLQLDAALQDPEHGPQLAQTLRRQFPLALIDEFQDTDTLQYRIFSTIYPAEADQAADQGLFLIGDPKQAIYAFRGADIHAYMAARRDRTIQLSRLDTNYRSSTAMVAAVNRLFERAEQRSGGAGAFLFRHGKDNPVAFLPVQATGLTERWQTQEPTPAALTLWHLAEAQPLSSATYRQQLAAACASEIARLLAQGAQGQAGFAADLDKPLVALQAQHIAVLVRNRNEASAMRQALQQLGIASVFLSIQDSVFASPEAVCLLAWLQACAHPEDDALLRTALASPSLSLERTTLETRFADELAWESEILRFRGYRERWRKQGVLPMLHHLLHDFQLPARLLRQPDGERRLTNLLHLAELLQNAAAELEGEQALIRYFSQACAETAASADEYLLRLESDAARVKIVTIHKSKGLEYPLVFLPFACYLRPVERKEILRYHDAEGRLRLSLEPSEAEWQLAERERLAEDLRLLYVALTRAQYACWLGVADIKYKNEHASRFHETALGYLLTGGEPLADSTSLASILAELAGDACAIAVQPPPDASQQRLASTPPSRTILQARQLSQPVPKGWQIASYTSLQRHATGTPAPETPITSPMADGSGKQATLHRFPRGAEAGTLLHGLLEWAGQEGFGQLVTTPERLRSMARQRCRSRGWESWSETVAAWLKQLLELPLLLPADSPCLADLQTYQTEMEFCLAAHHVDLKQLDQLILAETHGSQPRPTINEGQLDGYLRGSIDLAFEHRGRYYLVDYKSNWLGANDAAYTQEAMTATLLSKRYDLQYLLYLLALHRQLQARLPDYDYDQHMGGALLLFLRGADGHGHGVYAACPSRTLIAALDRLFKGEPRAAGRQP